MKARAITQQVLQKKDSKLGRILLFTGARQTGKTTLVQNALRDYRYISVEDPRMRGTYESLTASQWNTLYPKAIVDEVQKVPSLMESIQSVYDAYPQTRYALLGSSQILLLNKIHETLAGRCSILELYPLTLPELRTHDFEETVEKSFFQSICLGERDVHDELLPSFLLDAAVEDKQRAYDHYLTFGGYPAVSDEELSPAERWDSLDNYARTYLERDIADLATLREVEPFLKLRKIMALETGTLLNTEAIGRQIGCTGKTVKRYIQYLSLSYQSISLEPWARNPLRCLMKTPTVLATEKVTFVYTIRRTVHQTSSLMQPRRRCVRTDTKTRILVRNHGVHGLEPRIILSWTRLWRVSVVGEAVFVVRFSQK